MLLCYFLLLYEWLQYLTADWPGQCKYYCREAILLGWRKCWSWRHLCGFERRSRYYDCLLKRNFAIGSVLLCDRTDMAHCLTLVPWLSRSALIWSM